MAQQTINIGASPNDGTGTPLRTAFQYTNSNFSELYTAVGPSGNNIVVPGSATITGDLTVRTNKLQVTSTGVGIGMTPITPISAVVGTTGAVFFRTTDPAGPVSTPYVVAPVSTGFSSTAPVYSFWYQDCGISNPAVGAVGIVSGSSERYRIAADGIATWSNVGGVAGTAMTLNATGLGVGASPANDKLLSLGSMGILLSGATSDFSFRNSGGTAIQRLRYTDATGALTIGSATGTAYPVELGGNTTTRAVTIDASSNVGIGVTPSAGGGCLQLKSGITFPATQVASSDANTLDDYEEGGWVPTLNSGTFSSASCRYTKIGNMVTIFFDVTVGTGGGDRITNLPFAAASTSTVANGIYTNNQTYAAGTTAPVVVVGGSSSTLFFRTVGTGVAFSAMSLTAGANLTGSISYFV